MINKTLRHKLKTQELDQNRRFFNLVSNINEKDEKMPLQLDIACFFFIQALFKIYLIKLLFLHRIMLNLTIKLSRLLRIVEKPYYLITVNLG